MMYGIDGVLTFCDNIYILKVHAAGELAAPCT